MAWSIPNLGVDDNNKIFVSVKNESTVTMTVGHGVYWNYTVVAGGGSGSGYGVTFSPTAATNCINPGLLCGVVGRRDIIPGEYGEVQKFGQHDALACSGGASVDPFIDNVTLFASYTSWTASKFTNLILRPCHYVFGTQSTGMVANYGYFGLMAIPMAIASTAAHSLGALYPGGYAMPLGNVAATATYASAFTMKAFIHCLD